MDYVIRRSKSRSPRSTCGAAPAKRLRVRAAILGAAIVFGLHVQSSSLNAQVVVEKAAAVAIQVPVATTAPGAVDPTGAPPGAPPPVGAPAAPVAGPFVLTIYEERIAVKPGEIKEGKLVLPGEPARSIPLDEIEAVDLGNAPPFEAVWVGQDQRDLTQIGSAPGGNGVQDIHVRLNGLTFGRQVKQVVIAGAQAKFGVWRLDVSFTPSWRLAFERLEGASSAELFFEPKGPDCYEQDFTVTVTYDDNSVSTAALKASTHASDQVKIDTSQDPSATAGSGPPAVTLHGLEGVLIRGSLTQIGEQNVTLRTGWNDEINVPNLAVRGLWFSSASSAEGPARFAALLENPTNEDVVLATSGQSLSEISGAVESYADGKLKLNLEGKSRSLNAARVVAVVFAARPRVEAKATAYQLVQLTGGDRVGGAWTGISADALEITPSWGGTLKIPQNLVSRVLFKNGKMSYVSDLSPATVEETPYFGRVMQYRRDLGLLGGPLKVKGKEYAKGLAVHSRSVLNYDIAGGFQTFKATVGFDDTTAGRGSVACRVLGDGKELFAQPLLKASGDPAAVEVAVAGVKQLTLEIDFGEAEDTGDRVIWADAKLFREVPQPK